MQLIDGRFTLQGIDIARLAAEYGTPLYVYDAARIEVQYNMLSSAFAGSDLRIKYACKALTNLAILKLMKNLGAGVDCVSINEARMAMRAGHEPSSILFSPSCVGLDEIAQGVELGLSVNLDSISLLEKFGAKYGGSYPCSIRINPHIMAGGHLKISTGHSASKFGISVQQIKQILDLVRRYGIRVTGLHVHTGSDIVGVEVFLRMAEILFGIASDFPNLRFIDFGSGFKVSYKVGDTVTDISDLGRQLGKSFSAFCETYGRKLELWLEPGKFLVSEAGYLVAKTNVVKPGPSVTFVGVDSGFNHLIRPMMYEAYHDIVNISNPSGALKSYTVVGNICETDTFAADRRLSDVREGDLLVFRNAGAYGYSMASNYNSRFRPPEVMIHKGQAKLIRRRDVFEDLLANQVGADLD
jgi:diaminopimelate decarboxylase